MINSGLVAGDRPKKDLSDDVSLSLLRILPSEPDAESLLMVTVIAS